MADAMARVRERVWADYPEDETVILDIDSSVHEVHTENKQHAAPTYNRKYGFHPLYCFRTGLGSRSLLGYGEAAQRRIRFRLNVLDAAIRALPARMRVGHSPGDDPELVVYPVRVRADSAAGPSFATECHKRNVGFSFRCSILRRDRGSPNPCPRRRPTLAACPSQSRPTQDNNGDNRTEVDNPDGRRSTIRNPSGFVPM